MDFHFTPAQEAFREEVRGFLREELPSSDSVETVGGWSPEFSKRLAERGWIALPWPKEYGGPGLTHVEQMIFNEEMAYARAPVGAHRRGVFYVGPVLILHGTEEQKQEWLGSILRAERFFCQCFSEPGAGSDLASLQTRAAEDGDDFVVNGQKIWTSDAHRADYCWLAARTNPDAPKHRGISMFMVDMKSPGITVSPLVNVGDLHSFNQVFFDNVRVPKRNMVGEKDRGWYLSAETLDFERSSVANFAGIRRSLEDLARLYGEERAAGRLTDSHLERLRFELADLLIGSHTGTLMSYNVAWMQNAGRIPNKEASAVKLFSSELNQRVAQFGLRVLGLPGTLRPGSRAAVANGRYAQSFLTSPSATIGGGTSEIQRNVIATRGLGLPRG